ncbi:MAG: NGG1p interacting factor NIF3 [Bdellovibrio sp. CG12_big_fil_rev_8_21_14_0_65_39_13]|nr:MAG: NGG1p interacting factor NIF3 [Bdellovibrio sp. CG22_combo_CG10-13_8_21_14_all_39_27]PIQ57628.1 MAG: NGG1p interacting factor NIF3 [Bdellovibrio sp. CG12_big_fil_rev_8_21_14_0_65_39_13]PIR35792.1 MAG: NGG1p interacting factor NIF3 [Bdellovibrio sp. CG11_big_fil_rev_8_21_14_0_20_39_38]PJB52455.1 MAG: NGG1p interacting factor NIF3 [Bdellovibrio sp. CG_4_9_14_3_um_filter_39_7]
MFQIVVFVNVDKSNQVKEAMFTSGAGAIGEYENCCFESLGTGQFRPLEKANPYLGKSGEIEKVSEVRLEMVCAKENLKSTIEAMLKAHPYETPAYYVIPHYDWNKIQ